VTCSRQPISRPGQRSGGSSPGERYPWIHQRDEHASDEYQQSNEPTHLWTGGDGTFSVELPDGRIIWLFSDTYLGDVNPDGTRSTAPPIASNTAVVQDVNGGDLLETKAGADNRGFLGSQYWIMDGTVEGSSLRIFANNKGGGTSGIATVSLPGLVPTGTVQSVPSAHPDVSGVILWGGSILEESDYTYVYGDARPTGALYFTTYLARVPAGQLTTGTWEYWTRTGWSTTLADARPLADQAGQNVRASGSVVAHDGHYVLVGKENQWFTDEIRAYTSPSPAGPFTGPTVVYETPEHGQPCGERTRFTYRVNAHPAYQQQNGAMLFSYNVHCQASPPEGYDPSWNWADASLYRARFIGLDLP
jgi:hypothetical protein